MNDERISQVKALLGNDYSGSPASSKVSATVLQLEEELDLKFPLDLVALWSIAHEGAVISCPGAYCCADEAYRLHLLEEADDEYFEDETVLEVYERRFRDERPYIVSIGSTASGDSLVLNYKNSTDPSVLLYSLGRDYGDSNPFALLARSFSEFVERCNEGGSGIDMELSANDILKVSGFSGDLSLELRGGNQ